MPTITQLNKAIKENNLDKVKDLLQQKDQYGVIDLKKGECDSDNNTPIETAIDAAIDNKSLEILNYVLEQGAPINLENVKTGFYPIHILVSNNFDTDEKKNVGLEMIALFKKKGAEFNEKERSGAKRNPMILAIVHQNYFLIKVLHKNDSSVNTADVKGDTALSYARELLDRDHEVIKQLEGLGAVMPAVRVGGCISSRPVFKDRRVRDIENFFNEIHGNNLGDSDAHQEKRRKAGELAGETVWDLPMMQVSSSQPTEPREDAAVEERKIAVPSPQSVKCATITEKSEAVVEKIIKSLVIAIQKNQKLMFTTFFNNLVQQFPKNQQKAVVDKVKTSLEVKPESIQNIEFSKEALSKLTDICAVEQTCQPSVQFTSC